MIKLRDTIVLQALYNAIASRELGDYHLGAGNGNDPFAPSPFENGQADCSNWVHWIIGCVLNQQPFKGPYLNTDGIVLDAYGAKYGGAVSTTPKHLMFVPVPAGESPSVCDLVVSPGTWYQDATGAWKRSVPGHVGLISQIMPTYQRSMPFNTEGYKHLRAIHCNAGAAPAVDETNAAPWRNRGYLCRYRFFVDRPVGA